MATKVIMPKLGMAMSEGTLVKWLKADGAEVKKGEPVVVVMSKKITYQIESSDDGILRHAAKPKDVRGIGDVIGFLTAPGEEVSAEEMAAVAAARSSAPAEEAQAAAPAAAAAPKERPPGPSSPAARRLAQELGLDIARIPASGSRVSEDDVRRYHEALARIDATPLARRMADEEGLDLTEIKGSGPGGRITEEDALRALEERAKAPKPLPRSIPFLGMRQAIADQMVSSLQTMAQVTITAKADVTELKATREALSARWDHKVSYTDLLVKAVVVALKDHPMLGARLEGEEIVMPTEWNIGVAVALDDGLIVPVVRNADRLTVIQTSQKIQDLAQRARQNALNVDEVAGATFTITNMGMYGVDAFTPIINPPEVAILGVGGIFEELALIGGLVTPRQKMVLSLTIDHRIVDGAPGAAFLRTLIQLLERPALMFAAKEG
jgi:pyruvate dehydrogenase E2 component (dihydrolipoamide acetyltransferase)